ncbi:hypothetical protein HPP92_012534 [Vanilla planifolia]|uniref:Major facilitator superfamily (MFS) profile domain-containing protein n=1 Tax=Vanilla planifolia TaxID=51239 RepID=A0A835V3F3_VANPL|nr:hypothetical protein HPP92_012534 [Vanilla planifolia]
MTPWGTPLPMFPFSSFRTKMKTKMICGISLSFILINLASIMERADENLLPAVYKEVSQTFNAGPTDLGYLTFITKFIQAISSPLAGVLALRYDRRAVLALGTACWGLPTAAVGVSQNFQQVAIWRAVNGFGLAIVIPSLQSFIADSYKEGSRGTGFGLLSLVGSIGGIGGGVLATGFGLLSLVGSIGGIGGGVLATGMAGQEYWNMPGWRFAFIMMAILSFLIGLLVFLFVVDPRRTSMDSLGTYDNLESTNFVGKSTPASSSVWADSWSTMISVVKVQTFQIIILQGIVGSLPGCAMVFFTMWFELIGFDNKSSAALISIFAISCAGGSFLGGFLGDRVSKLYPDSGRIMCAQFSAFMGIPFSLILLVLIPMSVDSWKAYAVTLFLMGSTISWCATSANNPMFAEVVPAKHRTMIYAFDRAFEGSFSSFAAPAVGLLAERVYGYDSTIADSSNSSVHQAAALSRGLLTMMTVPFGLCVLFYTPLYVVFKRDRDSVKMVGTKQQELT